MYCTHERLAASCEDCRFVAALEAGHPDAMRAAAGRDLDHAPVNAAPAAAPELAVEDLHILRPDLDRDLDTEGSYTLIRAGDPIPFELAEFPRRPGSYTGPTPAARKSHTAASSAGAGS